jgi:hypothetical protein
VAGAVKLVLSLSKELTPKPNETAAWGMKLTKKLGEKACFD